MNTVDAKNFLDNRTELTWEVLEIASQKNTKGALIAKDLLTNNLCESDKKYNIENGTTAYNYLQCNLDCETYSNRELISLAIALSSAIDQIEAQEVPTPAKEVQEPLKVVCVDSIPTPKLNLAVIRRNKEEFESAFNFISQVSRSVIGTPLRVAVSFIIAFMEEDRAVSLLEGDDALTVAYSSSQGVELLSLSLRANSNGWMQPVS